MTQTLERPRHTTHTQTGSTDGEYNPRLTDCVSQIMACGLVCNSVAG